MYRHSPVRNPRSKGIKTKNVLQVCLLLAVCFWLIFQVKRSHDKKKEFDNTKKEFDTKISLNTNTQSNDEIEPVKFGRKDIHPKLEKEVNIHEDHEEEEEQEQEEEKINEEDETDESGQEKSEGEEIEEVNDEESQTEKEDVVGSIHTDEGREEHYKADDASSAVVTTENKTLLYNSNEEIFNNENEPPSNTTIIISTETPNNVNVSEVLKSNMNTTTTESDEGENLEGNDDVILEIEEGENDERHLEEKEVRMDLDTLPEIEMEGGNSEEDSGVERR